MEILGGDGSGGHNALLFLSFLGQADCTNPELLRQLEVLGRDVKDHNSNSRYQHDSGEIETDGHNLSNIRDYLGDLQPQADPINGDDLRDVIASLREIAEQFEQRVLTQATDSFAKKLANSAQNMWKNHLTLEVEWVVKNSQGLDLPRERVMMALALTLVKGVCERMPRLLRGLFETTMQYLH